MKVRFLGAARTVTGSCALIETSSKKFLVDCGLHQGNRAIEARNRQIALYRPEEIDFVLLTHAHMDHAGLLPALAANGFAGPIFCTAPTADLVDVMLEDGARIQESEAMLAAKKFRRQGRGNYPSALYTLEDAALACKQVSRVAYDKTFSPGEGIKATFYDAGHILGSGSIRLEIQENGKTTSLVFSGDIGHRGAPIIRDPENPPPADHIFMESTYGDRNHRETEHSLEELAAAISWSHRHGEKAIIPAFAVERTQEVLYTLYELSRQGKLPEDMPIFVDSPIATRASEIFGRHPEVFDEATRDIFKEKSSSAFMRRVRYTPKQRDSQAINTYAGPAIVISSSGMCNAGRVRHHLKHNLWRPGASIIFVGFQAVGTPGRKLVENARKLNIFGEDVHVAAKIFTINSFSAHAGQSELLAWLKPLVYANDHPQITLLHGELGAQKILADLIAREYGLMPQIPDYLEEMHIEGREAFSTPTPLESPGWRTILASMEDRFAEIKRRAGHLGQKSWEEQKEAEDDLGSLNESLARLLERL